MTRYKFIFLLLIFCINYIFSNINENNKLNVAVLDFSISIFEEKLDPKIITDLFQSELVNQNYFNVVERSKLELLLSEQKLELSGLTETEQATKVGALLGAHKIITGSISHIGKVNIFVVKFIDIKTGVIELTESINFRRVEELRKIIPLVVKKIVMKSKGEDVSSISFEESSPIKIIALIENKQFRNDIGKKEIQSICMNIPVKERIYLYQKYKIDGIWGFLFNLIPGLALGSWFQGDIFNALLVNIGVIIGGAVKNALIIGGFYTYSLIAPFIYSNSFNNDLKNSLLLEREDVFNQQKLNNYYSMNIINFNLLNIEF